jgi:hypothetical protein
MWKTFQMKQTQPVCFTCKVELYIFILAKNFNKLFKHECLSQMSVSNQYTSPNFMTRTTNLQIWSPPRWSLQNSGWFIFLKFYASNVTGREKALSLLPFLSLPLPPSLSLTILRVVTDFRFMSELIWSRKLINTRKGRIGIK